MNVFLRLKVEKTGNIKEDRHYWKVRWILMQYHKEIVEILTKHTKDVISEINEIRYMQTQI